MRRHLSLLSTRINGVVVHFATMREEVTHISWQSNHRKELRKIGKNLRSYFKSRKDKRVKKTDLRCLIQILLFIGKLKTQYATSEQILNPVIQYNFLIQSLLVSSCLHLLHRFRENFCNKNSDLLFIFNCQKTVYWVSVHLPNAFDWNVLRATDEMALFKNFLLSNGLTQTTLLALQCLVCSPVSFTRRHLKQINCYYLRFLTA